MKNFAALGKVQVCIFCIFCILQANFVFAATYIAPAGDPALNIPEYLSETQEDGVQSVDGHCTCGDGKSDPVDTNKLWKDNCFAVDGKSYQAGQYLTSCSGCLKFICRLKVQNEKDPDCEKYGWEKLLEDTCCQDCNGKVFPAGSVMKEQKLTDKCATTVTTKCAFIRGGTTATIWESSSYEKCCINSEGVQLLNTTKLVPKLCSVRICASQSGKHEPSYALIKTAHGCNCCQDGSKLYADGTWKIIQGKNATCCEGKWVVELVHLPLGKEEDITTTTAPTKKADVDCFEDPLGEGRCPENAGCFIDELGLYGPTGEHGSCHCLLGFYWDSSTNPPTCKDMRGGGNCDENGNSYICHENDKRWEWCPYCSTKKYSEDHGGVISLGSYVDGEGDYYGNDPQMFRNGDAEGCSGMQRSTEVYWYCWYDASTDLVPLDSIILEWSEPTECYYKLYVYTPLACCFADPDHECE